MTSGSDPHREAEGAAGDSRDAKGPGFLGDKKSDESWKAKAQKEKEKLLEAEAEADRKLPPASFHGLVDELALRALLALGQFGNPSTGEVYLDLESAKYAIDLLAVLQEKTKGNIDEEEKGHLEDALQQLRLVFVQVSRLPAGSPRGPGPRAGGSSGAVPPGASTPGEKPGPKIIF